MVDTVGVPSGVTIRNPSPTASTQYGLVVNSDGSLNVATTISGSSAVAITDGTTASQKAAVSAGGAQLMALADGTTNTQKASVSATGAQLMKAEGVSVTDRSGTLTTGSTAQTIMAANTSRQLLIVQNPVNATETLFVAIGKSASTTSGSFSLAAGGSLSLQGLGCPTGLVTVNAVTTAHAFNALEG